MSKELNEAQKRLKPLIDKAINKMADANLAYKKACEESMYTGGKLHEAEAAHHALMAAFDALGDKP